MSADVAGKFTQSPLQLDELTRQPNLIFAVIKNRAYGTSIDNFIAKQLDQQQRLDITSDNLSYMFRLLTVNKVDVTFAYPFEVAWFTKDKPQYRDNLILRPVANQPQFLVGHVTCPKTDWGKQVISRIDEALKNLKPTDKYKQAMTRWWPEQSIDNTFERFYQDHFLKNWEVLTDFTQSTFPDSGVINYFCLTDVRFYLIDIKFISSTLPFLLQ